MSEPLLQAEGLTKSFGGVRALRSVDFQLERGEIHALVGENGAGKSTFVKVLTGIHEADAGTITMDGQPVVFKDAMDVEKAGISALQQELILVPYLTIAENMALGDPDIVRSGPSALLGLLDRKVIHRRAREGLARVGVDLDPNRRASDLGASQAQMVLIARTLSREMRLLIMDEPTAALTPPEIEELKERLRRLKHAGVGIIYISHKLDEVVDLADRVTVFRDGRRVTTLAATDASVDEIVKHMLARTLDQMYPKQAVSLGRPLLEVRDLTREGALDNVSLTVRAGEIVGITGLIGAGKTELARALIGADPYDAGEVHLDGRTLRPHSPSDAIRAGMGMVPEDRKSQGLMLSLSVEQNLGIAVLNNTRSTRGLTRWGTIRGARLAAMADELVHQFRIRTHSIRQAVSELSGGNQQKVVFAKWLATSPKVMVLDEPTRGVDVGSKVEIYEAMEAMAAAGVAIIMMSSEVEEVLEMSDRVLVMRKGAVVAEFFDDEVTETAVKRATFAGVPDE